MIPTLLGPCKCTAAARAARFVGVPTDHRSYLASFGDELAVINWCTAYGPVPKWLAVGVDEGTAAATPPTGATS